MRCLDDDEVVEYVNGTPSPTVAAWVEEHIDGCEDCRRRIAALARQSQVQSFIREDDTQPRTDLWNRQRRPREEGQPALPQPGDRIGRYVVLRFLGQGGNGVVVAAHDPELDRQVAVKLIQPAIWQAASVESRALLRREAQAMARLSHPNVVAVHDAGTFADQLFVAMELVDGVTLSAWLQEKRRPWREILAVCLQAGRGLAAAHAAGLVHRDVKPHNLLIGADGRPRVADFGLALLAPRSQDGKPDSGLRWGAVGTPAYMAPEQHDGKPGDARTDQFGYCVTIYEALFGERPFSGVTHTEIAEAVRQGRLRPSAGGTRVPASLRRALARGLSVNPAARFPDMDALLRALDPTRRRRLAIGALALAPGLVLGALALTVRGPSSDPAREARAAARARLEPVWNAGERQKVQAALSASGRSYAVNTAGRVAALLDRYAEQWSAMRLDAALATRVRHEQSERILDLRVQCLDRRLAELRALVELLEGSPDPALVNGAVPAALGLTPIAACADAEALGEAVPPPDDPVKRRQVLAVRLAIDRARALRGAGKYKEAGAQIELAVRDARALGFPPLAAEALLIHGGVEHETGDEKGAEADFRAAAQAAAEAHDDSLSAQAWTAIVASLEVQSRLPDAAAAIDVAKGWVARAGQRPVELAQLESSIGVVALGAGQYAKAAEHLRRALDLYERTSGQQSLLVSAACVNLAEALSAQGKPEAAAAQLARAASLSEQAVGPDHPLLAGTLVAWGGELAKQGRLVDAEARIDRAIAILERAFGPDSDREDGALFERANLRRAQGRTREAREDYLRAQKIYERTAGPTSVPVATALQGLGAVAYAEEDYAEARRNLEKAVALFEARLGKDHPRLAEPLSLLGLIAVVEADYARALPICERALGMLERTAGPESPELAEALICIGYAQSHGKQPLDGVAPLERALGLRQAASADPLEVADVQWALAQVLWRARADRSRAVTLAEQARAVYAAAMPAMLQVVDAWLRERRK